MINAQLFSAQWLPSQWRNDAQDDTLIGIKPYCRWPYRIHHALRVLQHKVFSELRIWSDPNYHLVYHKGYVEEALGWRKYHDRWVRL
jgi:hypothetical protein